jgi:hypothetical protein
VLPPKRQDQQEQNMETEEDEESDDEDEFSTGNTIDSFEVGDTIEKYDVENGVWLVGVVRKISERSETMTLLLDGKGAVKKCKPQYVHLM